MDKLNVGIMIFMALYLASCGIVEAEPTPTSTPTKIPTPVPANSPTPTLEPWMQLLPESIESVEQEGEHIIGVDSNGVRMMEFDLEKGEWVKYVITDGPVQWVGWDELVWRADNTLDIETSGFATVGPEWFANGSALEYGLRAYENYMARVAAGELPAPPETKYVEDKIGASWGKQKLEWLPGIPDTPVAMLFAPSKDYAPWIGEGDHNAHPIQKSGEVLEYVDPLGDTWLIVLSWRHWKDGSGVKQVTPIYDLISLSEVDASNTGLDDAGRAERRAYQESCWGGPTQGQRTPVPVGEMSSSWLGHHSFTDLDNLDWKADYQDVQNNPDAAKRAEIWVNEDWTRLSEVPWGSICVEKTPN